LIFLFSILQVISYYSRRGGLGGVSVVTEKSDFSLTSYLLIRDANADDQVMTSLFVAQKLNVW
jgi:hypothetical protein